MPASATCATRTPAPPPWAPPHACPQVGSTLHLLPLPDTSSSQTARLPPPTPPSTSTPTSTATYPYTTSPGPCCTPHSTLPALHSHTTRWGSLSPHSHKAFFFFLTVCKSIAVSLRENWFISLSLGISFKVPGTILSLVVVSFSFTVVFTFTATRGQSEPIVRSLKQPRTCVCVYAVLNSFISNSQTHWVKSRRLRGFYKWMKPSVIRPSTWVRRTTPDKKKQTLYQGVKWKKSQDRRIHIKWGTKKEIHI